MAGENIGKVEEDPSIGYGRRNRPASTTLFNRYEEKGYTSVAIAVGQGILLSKNPTLSANLLTKEWAKYLFKRMGLVKRKDNTKAKVEIEKFDEVRKLFHQDIRNVIVMDEVPAELVVNWDQTVPVS